MYRIGQLAKLSGLTVETLRYYEQQGLLSTPVRGDNHYRLYDQEHLGQLRFVQRAKQSGLSIKDIGELVSLRQRAAEVSCGEVKSLIEVQLIKVQAQLKELQRFEANLSHLQQACCGGEESAENCAILKALDDVME